MKNSNSRIPERLTRAIVNNKLSHAYIIEGDKLSEKDAFATEFAKAVMCRDNPGIGCGKCRTCRMISEGTYRDIYYVSSDERSVKDKDIEDLQERLAKLPIEMGVQDGGRNIAIVDNADTMTTRAQNRLLKSLEEPQPGTVIMLLSENSDSLLPTIRSRCQTIRLYDEFDEEENQFSEVAKALINRAKGGSYFFESKDIIESNLKDRSSAVAMLDALEREFRREMIAATGSSEKEGRVQEGIEKEKSEKQIEFCKYGIQEVEKARKDIRYNVREKYVLSELMLKLNSYNK